LKESTCGKMTAKSGHHVMVSFQGDSLEIVLKIKKSLEESVYKVWVGGHETEGKIFENMAVGINNTLILVIAMTSKYGNSADCIKELQYSQERRKKIIPIKLESNFKPSGALGLVVAGGQYVDFSDAANFEESISALKRQIESTLKKIGGVQPR